MLEEWVRQNCQSNAPPKSSGGVFSGNLALTETKNTRPRPRRRRDMAGNLVELPYYPANGKESKRGSMQIPRALIDQYNRINNIMLKIEQGTSSGPRYVMVLTYYYTYHSIEIVATKMRSSVATVKNLKRSAFDQVVVLLQE